MSEGPKEQTPLSQLMNTSPRAIVVKGVTRTRWLLDVLASGLGIGGNPKPNPRTGPTDTGTQLAHERTNLALERTYWAAERTLMAWIRTALSMISFGFTIGKIGQAVQDVAVKGLRGMRVVGVESVAHLLVIMGTLALAAAAFQYSIRVHELHNQGLHREVSIAFAVSLILILLGGFALGSLVMNL